MNRGGSCWGWRETSKLRPPASLKVFPGFYRQRLVKSAVSNNSIAVAFTLRSRLGSSLPNRCHYEPLSSVVHLPYRKRTDLLFWLRSCRNRISFCRQAHTYRTQDGMNNLAKWTFDFAVTIPEVGPARFRGMSIFGSVRHSEAGSNSVIRAYSC